MTGVLLRAGCSMVASTTFSAQSRMAFAGYSFLSSGSMNYSARKKQSVYCANTYRTDDVFQGVIHFLIA
jgi:hypothetical protein